MPQIIDTARPLDNRKTPAISADRKGTRRTPGNFGAVIQIGVGVALAIIVMIGGGIAWLKGPDETSEKPRTDVLVATENGSGEHSETRLTNKQPAPFNSRIKYLPPGPVVTTPPQSQVQSATKVAASAIDSAPIESTPDDPPSNQPARQQITTVAATEDIHGPGKPKEELVKGEPEYRVAEGPGKTPSLKQSDTKKTDFTIASELIKSSPPSKEAQAAAEKTVIGIFKSDIDQANRGGPEAKLALSKRFLQQAQETADDPAARYVLKCKARDMALAASSIKDALEAINMLSHFYAIDAPADKFTALTTLAKNGRNQEINEAILIAAVATIDEAIDVDNYEMAGKFARLADGLAAKQHKSQAMTQLKAKAAEIEQLKKDFPKALAASEKLKTVPDDREANFVWGFFQGPRKGNFKKAMSFLAAGNDEAMSVIAVKDLGSPTDPADQVKLANDWWDLAESRREPIKTHLRLQAGKWYEKALPSLKGLVKAQADARLKQLAAGHAYLAASGRSEIVKALVEGEWHLIFYESTTEFSGPIVYEYPTVNFDSDGLSHMKTTVGKWVFLDDSAIIRVDFPAWKGENLWHIHVMGETLRCECFNPPGTLKYLGLGSRIPKR